MMHFADNGWPDVVLLCLQDGFSTMVTALWREAELDVRFQHEVVSVDRTYAADEGKVSVTTKLKDGSLDTHR